MPTPVCDDWLIDAFRPLTCNSAIFKNYAEVRVKWDSLNNWVWLPSATHRELEWDGKQKKQVKHILLLLVNSNVSHLFFKLLFNFVKLLTFQTWYRHFINKCRGKTSFIVSFMTHAFLLHMCLTYNGSNCGRRYTSVLTHNCLNLYIIYIPF